MTAETSDNAKTEAATATQPPIQQTPRPWRVAHSLIIALGVLGVLGVAIYSGIRSRDQAEAHLVQAGESSSVPSVDVVYPKLGSTSQEISLPGKTEPYIDTPIYARTSGYLRKWYFDIGSHVQKGQLLAVIETPELDEQLQQAEAELKNAQANLELAQITAGRWQNLLKTNSVSHQETDQAVSDLSAKQALVASSLANVHRLQQLQAYENVYAPFDGVITQRNTDIGDLIDAGQNTAPKEMFHLASVGTLRVYISVPEVYTDAVRTGEKVTLTFDEYPGRTFTGTLVRNSVAIDPATRTLNVEVDLKNTDGLLRPGAYVFVHLTMQPYRGAVIIPSNTLLFRSEGLRVAVVRDGHVRLAPVTIGHDYGSSVEVVTGLRPSDALLVDPSDSIESGQAVEVAKGSQP
jgi:RND family efflux transporter MFP subunit